MWAKGDGPSGFDPPIVELVNGNYSGLMPIEFPANQVGFYDPFEIQWSVSTASDPNGNWLPAGKSASPVYIVYTTSLVAGDNYHSLFYYGCKNAHGLNNPNTIVDNMYLGTFSSRTVPRKDSPTKGAMSYWGTSGSAPEPACFETAGLLRYEDGRCGAWARFFSDMIKAQGIGGGEIAQVVWQRSPSSLFLEFLSDKFTFFGLQSNQVQLAAPDATELIPQIFINNYQLTQTTMPNHFYVWGSEFVGDISSPWTPITLNNQNILLYGPLDGAAAQGNTNPQSTFANHALVKYNTKYFDPSYGSPFFTSKNEWENYALAGLGNGGGSLFKFYVLGVPFVERLMYVSESNNPNLQCTINP